MARRATYFFDVHKVESPRILVSGGWEFMDPNGLQAPAVDVMAQLSKAYEYMQYDVAFIGRREAEVLAEAGITPDKGRQTAKSNPLTIVTTSDGRKVGFYRFPSLPDGVNIPSPEMIESISKIIMRERATTDLLIGLSDWGWVGEREYYGQNPEYMPDFLFGSGYGSGVTGRFSDDRRCAWYRPYDKGRTVIEVQVKAWPDRTKPSWENPESVRSISIGLGDKYKDNLDVSDILH